MFIVSFGRAFSSRFLPCLVGPFPTSRLYASARRSPADPRATPAAPPCCAATCAGSVRHAAVSTRKSITNLPRRCKSTGANAAHHLAAVTLRQRPAQQTLEQEFDAWVPQARAFHLHLNRRPVKTHVHLRRLLKLAQLDGRTEGLAALCPPNGTATSPT